MFSSTVRAGISLKSWKTKPMPRRYSWISPRDSVGEVVAVDDDLALVGAFLHQQQAEERGLAGAARAGEEHELALAHRDREIPQRIQAAAIELRQAMRRDHVLEYTSERSSFPTRGQPEILAEPPIRRRGKTPRARPRGRPRLVVFHLSLALPALIVGPTEPLTAHGSLPTLASGAAGRLTATSTLRVTGGAGMSSLKVLRRTPHANPETGRSDSRREFRTRDPWRTKQQSRCDRGYDGLPNQLLLTSAAKGHERRPVSGGRRRTSQRRHACADGSDQLWARAA